MNKPAHIGCKVDGCPEPHRALGYCNVHYQRVHRTGSPHLAGRIGRERDTRKPSPRKRSVEDAVKVIENIVGTITLEQWKRNRDLPAAGVHVVRHQAASYGGDVA